MKRRLFGIFAAIVILLMALPPVFDTFDHWDKTPEIPVVGHNTETTVAVVAVGFGMCVAVAWAAVLLLEWLASFLTPRALKMLAPVQFAGRATEYLLLLFSPPWAFTTLRI